MNIDIKVSVNKGFDKVLIDGKDVTNGLVKVSIDKSYGTIPTVTMAFRPDKCTINEIVDCIKIDKGLKEYSIDQLSNELMKKVLKEIENTAVRP